MIKLLRSLFDNTSNILEKAHIIGLPDNAIEIELDVELFKLMNVDGYCFNISVATWFGNHIKSLAKNPIAKSEVIRFKEEILKAPVTTKYVCIFTNKPLHQLQDHATPIWKHAVRQHERCHCYTQDLPEEWYLRTASKFIEMFGSDWFKIARAINATPINQSMVERNGARWVSVSEALSIAAAVLSVAPAHREQIAKYQLPQEYKLVLELANKIELEYGTVLGFIERMKKFAGL